MQHENRGSVVLSCRKALKAKWNEPAVLLQEIAPSITNVHSEGN